MDINHQQSRNGDSTKPQFGNNPQQPRIGDAALQYYKVRNAINRAVTETTERFMYQDSIKSLLLDELKDLERHDRDIVTPEELKEALNSITKTIEDKLNESYEFKGKISQIGSSVDGTKTGQPDEFDYLYVVNRDSVEHKGNELFHMKEQLKASKISEHFMNEIDQIGTELDLTNLCLEHGGFASPSYSGCRRNGPAATLLFKTGDGMLISLDFTIAFPLSVKEETKILSDIASKAHPLLPCQDKTADFLKDTLCLVATYPDVDVWKVSTARLEATLLGKLSKDHCLKIAMRYGKILSKRQIPAISESTDILPDPEPVNIVEESLASYKENPTKERSLELQKGMRHTHIYLTQAQGNEFHELTSSVVKLDSASIKHLALRIVCKDHPELADAKGEDSAQFIIIKIMQELANHSVYMVENFLYKHTIKMVSIAGFVAPIWFDLTCLAKVRCEKFLTSNQAASEVHKRSSKRSRKPTQSLQFCPQCSRHQQEQLQELQQLTKGITEEADEQMGLPDACISGRDSNTDDTAVYQTITRLDESQYSGVNPLERMEQLATATKQSRIASFELPVVKVPPSAPRNLRVTDVGQTHITLAWDQPESDGGAKIIGYTVEQRSLTDEKYKSLRTVEGGSTTCKVEDLPEGTEYYFRVRAKNDAWTSEPIETVDPVSTKLPYDKPGPPRKLRVTDTNTDRISVEWDIPESDGGSEISNFIIEYRSEMDSEYLPVAEVDGRTTKYTVLHLLEQKDYTFRVKSRNAAGVSEEYTELAEPVTAQLPLAPPAAPRNLKVTNIRQTNITLTWDMPDYDGGAELIEYRVEQRLLTDKKYKSFRTVEGGSTSCKVANLSEGTEYHFRVRAKNDAGIGEPIETVYPVRTKFPFTESDGNLHGAASEGNVDRILVLLSQGADVNALDVDGVTALYRAAVGGQLDVLELLLSHGAGIERGEVKPLAAAAAEGHLHCVQWLIGNGANVNAVDGGGVTPLCKAAAGGHVDVMELLLSHGADTERGRWKPLTTAAQGGHLHCVQWLLEKGASQETKKQALTAALEVVKRPQHYDYRKAQIGKIIEMLKSHGAVADEDD